MPDVYELLCRLLVASIVGHRETQGVEPIWEDRRVPGLQDAVLYGLPPNGAHRLPGRRRIALTVFYRVALEERQRCAPEDGHGRVGWLLRARKSERHSGRELGPRVDR